MKLEELLKKVAEGLDHVEPAAAALDEKGYGDLLSELAARLEGLYEKVLELADAYEDESDD